MRKPKRHFKIDIIDVKKFAKTPCCGTVLQFLVLVNDLDAIVELNRCRRRPSDEPPNMFSNSWSKGALAYLERLNNSAVFECLDSTVSKVFERIIQASSETAKQKRTKKPKLLWNLIREDESLFKQITLLENFRTSPAYKAMDAIRDKLSAHADQDALKAGLRGTATSNENYGLIAAADTGQFRALFVDEAAVQQNIDYVTKQGVSKSEFAQLFIDIRKALVVFAKELLEKFCEENDLYANPVAASQVKQKIDAVTQFNFVPSERRAGGLWHFADS
jgi:hypothetical protein